MTAPPRQHRAPGWQTTLRLDPSQHQHRGLYPGSPERSRSSHPWSFAGSTLSYLPTKSRARASYQPLGGDTHSLHRSSRGSIVIRGWSGSGAFLGAITAANGRTTTGLQRDASFSKYYAMRRRRRILVRVRWVDILVVFALLAVMVSALIRWPGKILVDVALPTAFLILFVLWRER